MDTSYTTAYGYDRDNRRIRVSVPAIFATAAGDSIRSFLDPTAGGGRVTSVRDVSGNSVSLGYKLSGELLTLAYPGSINRTLGYDNDGQLTSDAVNTTQTGFPHFPLPGIRSEGFTYDARGKLLTAVDGSGFQEQTLASYSGLGYLNTSWMHQSWLNVYNGLGFQVGYSAAETPSHDALGNETARTSLDTTVTAIRTTSTNTTVTDHLYGAGGQLTRRDQHVYSYDAAGNQEWEVLTGIFERASYYSADGRLRATDYRSGGAALFGGTRQRTLEQYRYDALGRRVLVQTQVQCLVPNSFECFRSRVRRTIWDGSQELAEIQAPGDTAHSAQWEPSAPGGLNTRSQTDTGGYGLAYISNGKVFDPNPYYGQVAYSGGLGTDQPIGVTRYGYSDRPGGPLKTYTVWQPFTIFPQWNYRGQPVFGAFGDGSAVKQFLTGAGGSTCPGLADTTGMRCALFNWPAGMSAYDQRKGLGAMLGWHGTLIENKRDGSGLDYKRNRVYDPTTGRFTQQDPIGLAGGLNLYGYGSGDPVNFSDPFGQCRVRVGWKTASFPGQHAFIEMTPADATSTASVFRGGPTTQDSGASSGGSSNSSSASSSGSSSESSKTGSSDGPSSTFGSIRAVEWSKDGVLDRDTPESTS